MFSRFTFFSKMLPPHIQLVQPPEIYTCCDSAMPLFVMHLLVQKQQMVPASICYSHYFTIVLLQCFLFERNHMYCSVNSGHSFKRKAPFTITSFIKGVGLFSGRPILVRLQYILVQSKPMIIMLRLDKKKSPLLSSNCRMGGRLQLWPAGMDTLVQ